MGEWGDCMFNPLKQAGELNKLRQEAKKIQEELKKIEVEKSKSKATVIVTGDMKIKSIKLDGEEMFDIKEALNDAIQDAQKKAAMKMQQMGGGLRGLLGGD